MNTSRLPRPVRVALALLVLAGLWAVWAARLVIALPLCVWIVALQVVGQAVVAVAMWALDLAAALLGAPPAVVLAARVRRRAGAHLSPRWFLVSGVTS